MWDGIQQTPIVWFPAGHDTYILWTTPGVPVEVVVPDGVDTTFTTVCGDVTEHPTQHDAFDYAGRIACGIIARSN